MGQGNRTARPDAGVSGEPSAATPWFLRARWRLFGTLFLVLGLLMGVLASLISMRAGRALEAQAVEKNLVTAQILARVVEEHFDSLRRYVESFAHRPLVQSAVMSRNVAEVRKHLADIIVRNPYFSRAFVTDTRGVLWADYPPAPEVLGKPFAFRDWFKGVSQAGSTYVSKVYRRTALPRPHLVAIATPIRNSQQTIIGYLVSQHTTGVLHEWWKHIVPEPHDESALLDKDGRLIAGAVDVDLLDLSAEPGIRKALMGQEVVEMATDPVSGIDSLISYVSVPSTGWVVMSRQPRAEVLAPIAALQRQVLGVTVAVFAAMVILGFFWLNTMRSYHQALRGSEARFRGLLESAPDAIIIVGRDGDIGLLNSEAEKLFGYSREELVGRKVEALVPEHARAVHARKRTGYTDHPLTRPMGLGMDLSGLRKDGVEFPVEISLSPHASGDEQSVIAIVRDVTERRRIEREVLQLNRDLRDHSAELEAVNDELEAFSYSVSHDLRTPLRSIDGFSQALLEDYNAVLDEQGQDYLQRVRKAAQRMDGLIDDLLQLSRVSRYDLHRAEVNLSKLVEEITEEYTRNAAGRRVRLNITPDLRVQGDARMLRIALANLVDNAWKFTADRSDATIEFGVESNDGATNYFLRDNGVGFDLTYADKLFGPFQRLHNACEYPGSGIGLATVQRVIHKHGGRIWAHAQVDQGATFYFTI